MRALLKTPAFIRAARRLAKRQPHLLSAIRETLSQLERDAFDPGLRTHKLKGDLTGTWACSAGYDLRIVFEVVSIAGKEAILLLSIGSHDEVY